jgi:hypothetical protein
MAAPNAAVSMALPPAFPPPSISTFRRSIDPLPPRPSPINQPRIVHLIYDSFIDRPFTQDPSLLPPPPSTLQRRSSHPSHRRRGWTNLCICTRRTYSFGRYSISTHQLMITIASLTDFSPKIRGSFQLHHHRRRPLSLQQPSSL